MLITPKTNDYQERFTRLKTRQRKAIAAYQATTAEIERRAGIKAKLTRFKKTIQNATLNQDFDRAWGGMLELDYARFVANPAEWRIGVYNAQRGEEIYFSQIQVDSEQKLIHVCKASGSMPIATPVTYIAGEACMDGAIGRSGGIPLDVAQADGYEKFLVLLTRPREYVKENRLPDLAYRCLLARYQQAAQSLINAL